MGLKMNHWLVLLLRKVCFGCSAVQHNSGQSFALIVAIPICFMFVLLTINPCGV